ncbi:hypothetical protein GCM10029964_083380 [Kibdelosporangium lantanae]
MSRRRGLIHTAKRRSAQETADDQFAVFQHVCPTGIALVGPEGTIASVNPALAHLTRTQPDRDLVGAAVADLGASEHDRTVLHTAIAALTSNATDRVTDRQDLRCG